MDASNMEIMPENIAVPQQPLGSKPGASQHEADDIPASTPTMATSTPIKPMPQDQIAPSIEDNSRPKAIPVSQEQLIAELKGIYVGLRQFELRCIEVDVIYSSPSGAQELKEDNEKLQKLVGLHCKLLNMHQDFFMTSHHPSASPALRKLPLKYALPARMWRCGIHSLLELLRRLLPHSLEHMLAFIHFAYGMLEICFEALPAFEDRWLECLGDLGRYRWAIEDEDIQHRRIWKNVARHWYSTLSDKSPTTGRLHHHLAILARPNALKQLSHYAKSLTVAQPFAPARKSILMLFDPLLKPGKSHPQHLPTVFVKVHAILFTQTQIGSLSKAVNKFYSLLRDNHFGRITRNSMQHMAIANSVALLGFGAADNILFKLLLTQARTPADVFDPAVNLRTSSAVRPRTSSTPVDLSTIVRPRISCILASDLAPELGTLSAVRPKAASTPADAFDPAIDLEALSPPEISITLVDTPEPAANLEITSEIRPADTLHPPANLGITSEARPADTLHPPANLETMSEARPAPTDISSLTLDFTNRTAGICLAKIGDPIVLPYVHVTLVFLLYFCQFGEAIELLSAFPKQALTTFLNRLIVDLSSKETVEDPRIELWEPSESEFGEQSESGVWEQSESGFWEQSESEVWEQSENEVQDPRIEIEFGKRFISHLEEFPIPDPGYLRPLPEDWEMHGLPWVRDYFPDKWFSNEQLEYDERFIEKPSMINERKVRVLFLAQQLVTKRNWLTYDSGKFSVPEPQKNEADCETRT
jgi:hypothetical protein